MYALVVVAVVAVLLGYVIGRAGSVARAPSIPMRELSRRERDELIDILARDGRIHAIRRARELTGSDLHAANEAMKQLEAELGPRALPGN